MIFLYSSSSYYFFRLYPLPQELNARMEGSGFHGSTGWSFVWPLFFLLVLAMKAFRKPQKFEDTSRTREWREALKLNLCSIQPEEEKHWPEKEKVQTENKA